jgi:hypothetical protein
MSLHPLLVFAAVAGISFHAAPVVAQVTSSTTEEHALFTHEQLDDLVAPVALYPDAILAQLLVASTFYQQVAAASRHVAAYGARGIDEQSWDISVKAIAHYPPLLNMLARQEDWTAALGRAYVLQSGDVMDAVQRLRAMAYEQGNLVSTAEQEVIVERERILIVPAQPQVIYVPTYNPRVVYYVPVSSGGLYHSDWSFGIGYPIGAWLSYDCDWWSRRVVYSGWGHHGWRSRSMPYIYITNVYVNPNYHDVNVNYGVLRRPVNYVSIGRYSSSRRPLPAPGSGAQAGANPGTYKPFAPTPVPKPEPARPSAVERNAGAVSPPPQMSPKQTTRPADISRTRPSPRPSPVAPPPKPASTPVPDDRRAIVVRPGVIDGPLRPPMPVSSNGSGDAKKTAAPVPTRAVPRTGQQAYELPPTKAEPARPTTGGVTGRGATSRQSAAQGATAPTSNVRGAAGARVPSQQSAPPAAEPRAAPRAAPRTEPRTTPVHRERTGTVIRTQPPANGAPAKPPATTGTARPQAPASGPRATAVPPRTSPAAGRTPPSATPHTSPSAILH